MKSKAAPPKPPPAALAAMDEPVDDTVDGDDSLARIVSRPDGFHWLAADGRQEFGPFETIEDAFADMEVADEEGGAAPGTTLQEAEDEIGIADWIDPDTGEPAEGHSPPHLQDE
jgi:hypothetical protein